VVVLLEMAASCNFGAGARAFPSGEKAESAEVATIASDMIAVVGERVFGVAR